MGATLSYLGYASHQQPLPRSHEHASQQPYQGRGPTLIFRTGDSASRSIIDLCARLAALEKDLQISRTGNTNKDTVIQYLLQSSVSKARVNENTVYLKEQLLILKTTIARMEKEKEEIKDRLQKAEDVIFAVATPSIPNSRSQSTSTSFSSRRDSPAKSNVVTEDLIDLLGCSHESEIAKCKDEDATLLDEDYEDELENEGEFNNTTPIQSLHLSFDTEFEGPSYITHFADSDEDANHQNAVEVSGEKLLVPRASSESFTPPQQQYKTSVLSKKSDESFPENLSSMSGRNSTAVSFSSTSSGSPPLKDLDARLLNKVFSELKALGSARGNLEKSIDEISNLASGYGTRNQAEPPRPTAQAPGEAQDLQTVAGGNATEPHRSPEIFFKSAQYRGNTALQKRSTTQAEARDVRYPDSIEYGIRYVPKIHEHDVYRTVAISGLQPSVTLMALLEKVRGGMVVDAKLLDTAKITSSNTALVTFHYESSARAYENYAKHHRIVFSDVVAQVAVVSTPTWPIPSYLRTSIEEFGNTRCFEIHNIPRNISLSSVRQELTASPVMKSDSLECMRLGADGVLGLRFSSIRAAAQSSALFRMRYRGCTVKHTPDPCAQPLETLVEHRTAISEAVEEATPESSYDSEAKAMADEQVGRLTKVG